MQDHPALHARGRGRALWKAVCEVAEGFFFHKMAYVFMTGRGFICRSNNTVRSSIEQLLPHLPYGASLTKVSNWSVVGLVVGLDWTPLLLLMSGPHFEPLAGTYVSSLMHRSGTAGRQRWPDAVCGFPGRTPTLIQRSPSYSARSRAHCSRSYTPRKCP